VYVKPHRVYHLPWSNPSTDDKVNKDLETLKSEPIVVTVKMDGSNISMYRDHIHCRSLDLATGPEYAAIKSIHAKIAYDIPENWRICGENLFCKHSIHYHNLPSYFMIFGVWNEKNECLSWNETEEWAALLGRITVPVLYKGIWDEDKIKSLYQPMFKGDEMEGYVVRVARKFLYEESQKSIAKYVRMGHNIIHGKLEMIQNELCPGIGFLE